MALVAGRAAVYISSDVVMFIVGIVLVVLMTFDALEGGESRGIGVAVGTGVPLSPMATAVDRKILAIMLGEIRPIPASGAMADLAIGREPGPCVVRISGTPILTLMAGIAVGWSALEAVAMAGITIQTPVGTGQSKDQIVIEIGPLPRTGVVTGLARSRKPCCRMIGILRVVVFALVTGVAVGRSALEAPAVTRLAIQPAMTTGQAEEFVVVEDRALPAAGVVATATGFGETRGDVVGIGGRFVVIEVTGVAPGGSARIPVRMAVFAVQRPMGSGQAEELVVIEICTFPGPRVVADLTIGGEPGRDMVRVPRLLVVRLVAAEAVRGGACEAVLVTV